MSKNFKDIPTQFKYKIPKNFEWEVHNLHAYAELKEAVAKGEKTIHDLREFEEMYREKEDQREWRWRRENIMVELQKQSMEDYKEFKENPKAFFKKAMDMRKAISQWWFRKPKPPAGKGRMIQNKFTGNWQQEYKPNRSMNMKKWLEAAENGHAMPHLNPKGVRLNRTPTQEEVEESKYHKQQRAKKVMDWLLKETDNFGRGWGTGVSKKLPGQK